MITLPKHPSLATELLYQVRSRAVRVGYRRRLREQLERIVPPYVLHALAKLPLPLRLDGGFVDDAPTSDLVSLASVLEQHERVALYGPPGSGRSLALLQIAWRWVMGGNDTIPLLLDLPRQDRPHLSPRAIVIEALLGAGEIVQPASDMIETRRPWLLLANGWEELPDERRADWHAFLLALGDVWPGSQLLLTLPAGPDQHRFWPTCTPVVMCPPDDEQRTRILATLLPRHDLAPIRSALAPDGTLAEAGANIIDLVLLAGIFSEAQAPQKHIDLWNWAYDHLVAAPVVSQRNDWLRYHPMMRCYRHARDIASGASEQLNRLTSLPSFERDAVAVFAADLMPDPAPLYATLWGNDQPAQDDLLTIGRCMVVRQKKVEGWATVSWASRELAALTEQAEKHPSAAALLLELQPTLEQLTGESLAQGAITRQELLTLLRQLPAQLAAPQLLRAIDAAGGEPDWRWEAADALLTATPSAELWQQWATTPTPDTTGAATRCYLLSLAGPDGHSLLDDRAVEWAQALCDDQVAGVERQVRAGAALLEDPSLSGALRAIAAELLGKDVSTNTQTLLTTAYRDAPAPVRDAVLLTLEGRSPEEAIQLLARTALDATVADSMRLEAVERLAHYRQGTASISLARCALSHNLPLWGRLLALQLLTSRRGATVLLRKLLRAPAAHDLVRAAAVEAIATQGETLRDQPLLIELVQTLLDNNFPLARQSAARALGTLGKVDAAMAVRVLSAVIEADTGDVELLQQAVTGLGQLRDPAAVPLLTRLLGAGALAHMRRTWAEQIRQCEGVPVDTWPIAAMPLERRDLIITTFAQSESLAARPSTLDDILQLCAIRLSAAAAQALVEIGGRAARDALAPALRTAPSDTVPPLIAALDAIIDGPAALVALLEDPVLAAPIRWLIVQQLAPRADETMLQHIITLTGADPFARGALARALGKRGDSELLPILRRLADNPAEDLFTRAEAVAAMGVLNDPAVETTLLPIVVDPAAPLSLRRAAAIALPSDISLEARRVLRELMRHERPPTPLLVGVLTALGTARDRESLSALLRYCQHEQPEVAEAALSAITSIGEVGVVPVLVQISQSALDDQTVRLQAIGVLLRLGGEEFVPLLRPMLECGVLPMQLQALEQLLAACPDSPLLPTLLRNQTTPLLLRQRIARAVVAEKADVLLPLEAHTIDLFCALLADPTEDVTLRALLAELLGTVPWQGQDVSHESLTVVSETLLHIVQEEAHAPELRLRCIKTLAALDTPAAWLGLSQIATNGTQPEDARVWALSTHLDSVRPRRV